MSRKGRASFAFLMSCLFLWGGALGADDPKDRVTSATLAGLELRSLGPAFMSGRISDIAKDPSDPATWYVAVSSGGVWKTVNSGTTWQPIFDDYGSYSIGCVTVDPRNPWVVWVGTGEANSQRSVGWGDGIYKSLDGGASFTNVGLESSEHIAKILIDPRDSGVVYAASQGPLWASGGDRGLYKTTDGGATWTRVLEVSENTGITDVVMDPRDPDTLYAASYQRRRRVWTLIAGGPESAIYKSTDGGASWRKLETGLPTVHMGRIGLAVAPENPDVVYATIPAEGDHSGFYRSVNLGETWERMSDYITVDPQYYQKLYPDPHRPERIYSMDMLMQVSEDAGRTFKPMPWKNRHVDTHVMLFDADDPEYLMVGGDGGIYESWDRGQRWKFVANLPITQFYRVGTDNAEPFYNVYGGTQDNSSQGAPSRNTSRHGITNRDWFVTVTGDGYQTRVDPDDPNIVYSMFQYGGLVRYDRLNGEAVDIQPQPEAGGDPIRWHWDSPLIISPHSGSRLYFAGNRLFRSDDRGDTWRAVSPDLTRGIDRNQLEVMGRVWSVDAVWKNVFTSFYGNIVALDESELVEGLIYVGTDDGLIQVTENGGESWREIGSFPGVPKNTYVADVVASVSDPDTVYAAFNNHKSGDFKPYMIKSNNRGGTWESIAGDLPEGHALWSIIDDDERGDLLFAGTEFGLFFTIDGGGHWVQLKGGVPTVAFRDLQIQRRENDLVAGTFGRGIYILDDYTPLRLIDADLLDAEAATFPVKTAHQFLRSSDLGWGEKGTFGDAFYAAPNPPFGAVLTYHLKDSLESRHEVRRKAERERAATGESVAIPSWDELREADLEEEPSLVMTVEDASGVVLRRVSAPPTAGIHRVAWDLRWPSLEPVSGDGKTDEWGHLEDSGPLVAPGRYTVRLQKRVDGVLTEIGEAQTFDAVPLGIASLPAQDRQALAEFHRRAADLQRAVRYTVEVVKESYERIAALTAAMDATPGIDSGMTADVVELRRRFAAIEVELLGDETIRKRNEPTKPSIVQRIDRVMEAHWSSSSAATATHRRNYEIASDALTVLLDDLRPLVDRVAELQQAIETAGGPWTSGSGLPIWPPQR
jgi:photosystem II stability/assembly factor-like uncharacterized protein